MDKDEGNFGRSGYVSCQIILRHPSDYPSLNMNRRDPKTARPQTVTEIQKTSLFSLRRHYTAVLEDLQECQRQRSAVESVASDRRKTAEHQKYELRKKQKQILTLTRSAKASEEAKKGATWSAASASCIAILYNVWSNVTGYPGGRLMASTWEMPEVCAAMTGLLGCLLAWAYKVFHPASRD